MKLKVLFGLAIVCVALWVSGGFATDYKCYSTIDTCYVCWDTTTSPWVIRELDLGVCDTVRIGCPVCANFSSVAVGDSFAVPIYLYSSNAIGGLTLGFRHNGRGLKFGGYGDIWDPTGGILTTAQQSGIHWAVDTLEDGQPRSDSATALMGWIDMTSKKPIAKNTTDAAKLLGSVWLVLTDTIRQTIRFDSLFYPPAGKFILSCRDSITGGSSPFIDLKLTPKFVTCREVASPPCDINLGDTPEYYFCGDVDGSGNINIADIVYMVSYIFGQGAPPQNTRGGDMDCDLRVTIADVVHLINYIFRAGPEPCLGCM